MPVTHEKLSAEVRVGTETDINKEPIAVIIESEAGTQTTLLIRRGTLTICHADEVGDDYGDELFEIPIPEGKL